MKKEKLGQEPAFPQSEEWLSDDMKGMSKRFYAACAAMQGILSTSAGLNINDEKLNLVKHCKLISELSFVYADELLKQENE